MDINVYLEKAKALKTKILYDYLKIDQARDYIMRLSDRERRIVSISAVALAIFILIGFYSLIAAALDSKEKGINREIKDFENILKMRGEYLSYYAIIKKIEKSR